MKTFQINNKTYSQSQLLRWATTVIAQQEEPWMVDIATFIFQWFDETDWITIHTSGTTGDAKTMRVHKSAMVASAERTNAYFDINEKTTALLCIPAKYIGGKMMIVRALISGAHLLWVKPCASPLDFVEDQTIDFCAMIPLQVRESLASSPSKFHSIHHVIIGGAPISPSLERQLSKLNQNIYATFGMTETLSHIALRCIAGDYPTPYFQAMAGVTFEKNAQNCLIIHAPHILPQAVVTRDIIEWIDSNQFIWKGRLDQVINSGGIKIIAEEVEHIIQPMMGNMDYFIAGQEDERLGQHVILVIEKIIESQESDLLLAQCKALLPKYHEPKSVWCIPKFERTATGKIQRKKTLLKQMGYN